MRTFWIYILSLSFFACQQPAKKPTWDKNNPPVTYTAASDSITSNNIINALNNEIKHYPIEPVYLAFINNEQCYYEILINDVLLDRYFSEGKRMSPFYINSHILKSGKQTLTYRLYPNTAMGFETLAEFTNLKVEIGVVDQKKGISFSNIDTILVHQAARNPDNTFIATGKDYYEFTIEFDAQVPYEEVGWTKSKDLRQMDPDTLLARTELAYQYIIDLIKNKDKDTFAKLHYYSLSHQIKNNYDDIETAKKASTFINSFFNEPTLKINELQGFTLKLYGNGKIIALQLTNPDPFYKLKSAIGGFYIDEDGDRTLLTLKLLLHLPEGKDTFEIL